MSEKIQLFSRYISENYMKGFKGNKYLLVNVAAQRARQINDGVEVYVKTKSRHPLEVALEEIHEGFIDFELGAPPELDEIPTDDLLSFEEMVSLEGDFDFEDEEPLDIDALDLDQEMLQYEEEETAALGEDLTGFSIEEGTEE